MKTWIEKVYVDSPPLIKVTKWSQNTGVLCTVQCRAALSSSATALLCTRLKNVLWADELLWWGKVSRVENLQRGEVPLLVKDKLHLHVTLSSQRVVPPAQVVVARPHVVLTRQQEVVQADHTVRELTHPAEQPPTGQDSCQSQRAGKQETQVCDEGVWLASSHVLHHTWSRWGWRWGNQAASWADPPERCRRSDRLKGGEDRLAGCMSSSVEPQHTSAHTYCLTIRCLDERVQWQEKRDHHGHHDKGPAAAAFINDNINENQFTSVGSQRSADLPTEMK